MSLIDKLENDKAFVFTVQDNNVLQHDGFDLYNLMGDDGLFDQIAEGNRSNAEIAEAIKQTVASYIKSYEEDSSRFKDVWSPEALIILKGINANRIKDLNENSSNVDVSLEFTDVLQLKQYIDSIPLINDDTINNYFVSAMSEEGNNAEIKLLNFEIYKILLFSDRVVVEMSDVESYQQGFGKEDLGNVGLVYNIDRKKWFLVSK